MHAGFRNFPDHPETVLILGHLRQMLMRILAGFCLPELVLSLAGLAVATESAAAKQGTDHAPKRPVNDQINSLGIVWAVSRTASDVRAALFWVLNASVLGPLFPSGRIS